MLAVLVVIGLLALAWPVARGTSRPSTRSSRRRTAERRARYVARNPHEVTHEDIRAMLRRGGLSPEEADFVSTRAADLRIGPFTMLIWLKRFDATALATVVAADLSHDALISHVSNGTVPDLEGLAVFAELNGFGTGSSPAGARASDPMRWAMENGKPVTMETLGMFDEVGPVEERPADRDDFGAA